MAEPLTIDAPDALSAFMLTRLLGPLDAACVELTDGRFEVRVPLDGAPPSTVPDALAAARRWLRAEGLTCTRVQIDGHPQMLR